jgi:molybdopterin-guanine dinucleotide biosynthesis protein A
MTLAFAVVPSNGRPVLDECLAAIGDQVDTVILIGNNWQRDRGVGSSGAFVSNDYDDGDQNISRWWNRGLAKAERLARFRGASEWDVAVINDDAILPRGWVETLSSRMRATSAVCAYPDQAGGQLEVLHTVAEPVPLSQRIAGYAFMLRGEAGLRADESLVWWYGDDSLDWEARENGGALLVPGIPVEHRAPDVQTNASPVLTAQAGRDRQTFINRWGKAPH